MNSPSKHFEHCLSQQCWTTLNRNVKQMKGGGQSTQVRWVYTYGYKVPLRVCNPGPVWDKNKSPRIPTLFRTATSSLGKITKDELSCFTQFLTCFKVPTLKTGKRLWSTPYFTTAIVHHTQDREVKTHILSSGTSRYRRYKGVPPGGGGCRNRLSED